MKYPSPYGQTVAINQPAVDVECWNFTDNSVHTLPTGSLLTIEHVHNQTSTTCMLSNGHGEAVGIELTREDGTKQTGYRFIIENKQLARITGLHIQCKAFDLVGAIMTYEQGDMDQKSTLDLFRRLKKDGLLGKLQGHYGREAQRLGVA